MLIRKTAMALVFCAVAVIGAGAASAAAPQEELLASEGARLAAHASQPEAAGALATLAALDEDVDPHALEAAVRGGLGKGAHPLVAAQASWLLARLRGARAGEGDRANDQRHTGTGSPTQVQHGRPDYTGNSSG